MFQPWRRKLRVAEEAFRAGRLEEASQLLRENDVCEFLPTRRLLAKVADQMVQRAKRRVAGGQSLAGWRDLESARRIGADGEAASTLRQELIGRRLAEAESYLAAGEPAVAISRLDELARHGSTTREVRTLREAALKYVAAQRASRQGKFAEADGDLAAAAALAPRVDALADVRKACQVKADQCHRLTEQLHAASSERQWTKVLSAAESMLELCPEHEAAQDARRRAWAAAGMAAAGMGASRASFANASPVIQAVHPLNHHAREAGHRSGADNKQGANGHPAPVDHALGDPASDNIVVKSVAPNASLDKRFLLWLDGVGGYLVCQGDQVTLGQPVPESQVDVPILGDISRRHARIIRDGEAYLIEPLRRVLVGGHEIDRATLLGDGAMIELDKTVRLRFRRPHPLSATARLEFVSHHRTQPSSDGVLLFADTCVLGPSSTSHVVCRNWPREVVLFRQGNDLFCRTAGRFEIDGAPVVDRGKLASRSQVVGDEFSLGIESL